MRDFRPDFFRNWTPTASVCQQLIPCLAGNLNLARVCRNPNNWGCRVECTIPDGMVTDVHMSVWDCTTIVKATKMRVRKHSVRYHNRLHCCKTTPQPLKFLVLLHKQKFTQGCYEQLVLTLETGLAELPNGMVIVLIKRMKSQTGIFTQGCLLSPICCVSWLSTSLLTNSRSLGVQEGVSVLGSATTLMARKTRKGSRGLTLPNW